MSSPSIKVRLFSQTGKDDRSLYNLPDGYQFYVENAFNNIHAVFDYPGEYFVLAVGFGEVGTTQVKGYGVVKEKGKITITGDLDYAIYVRNNYVPSPAQFSEASGDLLEAFLHTFPTPQEALEAYYAILKSKGFVVSDEFFDAFNPLFLALLGCTTVTYDEAKKIARALVFLLYFAPDFASEVLPENLKFTPTYSYYEDFLSALNLVLNAYVCPMGIITALTSAVSTVSSAVSSAVSTVTSAVSSAVSTVTSTLSSESSVTTSTVASTVANTVASTVASLLGGVGVPSSTVSLASTEVSSSVYSYLTSVFSSSSSVSEGTIEQGIVGIVEQVLRNVLFLPFGLLGTLLNAVVQLLTSLLTPLLNALLPKVNITVTSGSTSTSVSASVSGSSSTSSSTSTSSSSSSSGLGLFGL